MGAHGRVARDALHRVALHVGRIAIRRHPVEKNGGVIAVSGVFFQLARARIFRHRHQRPRIESHVGDHDLLAFVRASREDEGVADLRHTLGLRKRHRTTGRERLHAGARRKCRHRDEPASGLQRVPSFLAEFRHRAAPFESRFRLSCGLIETRTAGSPSRDPRAIVGALTGSLIRSECSRNGCSRCPGIRSWADQARRVEPFVLARPVLDYAKAATDCCFGLTEYRNGLPPPDRASAGNSVAARRGFAASGGIP